MTATERLGALALLALSLILALARPEGTAAHLLVVALALAATLALTRIRAKVGALGLLRDLAPFAVMLVIFTQLQPAIEATRAVRYDAFFAQLDERWLGGLVRAWHGALGRPDALTDAAYVVYWSFYALPLVVLLPVRRRERPAFDRAAFLILLGFYLSFVGYFLWPTSGPRLQPAEEAALGGGAITRAVQGFLRVAEATTLDAFPSGHTAISMLSAHVGARHFPRAAAALWAWAAAIVFATVYIHVHYAVDLLGGAALFGVTLLLAPWGWRWLGVRRTA
jgi:membrane-associated phospholipid phosphatase